MSISLVNQMYIHVYICLRNEVLFPKNIKQNIIYPHLAHYPHLIPFQHQIHVVVAP